MCIANEIVEAFAKGFPGHGEGQTLWAILRKTYGWHKKEDAISISQIMGITRLSRRMVIYCLKNLEAKNMILIKRSHIDGFNEVNNISFQKDYSKWVVQEKSQGYVKTIQKQIQKGSARLQNRGSARLQGVVQDTEKSVRNLAPTKDTITKDNKKEIYKEKENIPYQNIIDLYREHCPTLPGIQTITPGRKVKIKARWNEYKNLEKFTEIFKRIESSDFLKYGNSTWKGATFDWIFKNEEHIARILEGNYDNEGRKKPTKEMCQL